MDPRFGSQHRGCLRPPLHGRNSRVMVGTEGVATSRDMSPGVKPPGNFWIFRCKILHSDAGLVRKSTPPSVQYNWTSGNSEMAPSTSFPQLRYTDNLPEVTILLEMRICCSGVGAKCSLQDLYDLQRFPPDPKGVRTPRPPSWTATRLQNCRPDRQWHSNKLKPVTRWIKVRKTCSDSDANFWLCLNSAQARIGSPLLLQLIKKITTFRVESVLGKWLKTGCTAANYTSQRSDEWRFHRT